MALSSQIDAAARGDTKPPPAWRLLGDHDIDLIPDASDDQWRQFGIGIADHILAPTRATVIRLLAGAEHPFSGHDCQLSHSRDIRVCDHPEHARDAAALRAALIVLGVAPDPYPSGRKRARTRTKHRTRSTCPVCTKRWSVLADGTMGQHPPLGSSVGECPGFGQRPAEPEAAAS